MKRGSFRKVNFTIEHTHMYGHYCIKATYKGKEINIMTTDSKAYDWVDDDSDKEEYNDARRRCYYMIRHSYEN